VSRIVCVSLLAHEANIQSEREPLVFPSQSRTEKRPDVRLLMDATITVGDQLCRVDSLCLDVTVAHVMCPSLLKSSIPSIVKSKTIGKIEKYAAILASPTHAGHDKAPEAFAPFVMTSSGSLSSDARAVIRQICEVDGSMVDADQALLRVSIAMLNGIAAVLSSVSGKLRRTQ